MIAILSPAKNMRKAGLPGLTPRSPLFSRDAAFLAELLRELSPWQLESLFSINPKLALQAFTDFQAFDPAAKGSPAALSYYGLAFQNLNAASFSVKDFAFADAHLRILSAFYGLLRPSDGILPYRLEMQCKFKVNGENLYRYWGGRIYEALFGPGEPVLNLASGEYAKLITPYLKPTDTFITCDFLVMKRQRPQCLATFAKMARGQMARYLILNRVTDPQGLRDFDWQGFTYAPSLSSPRHWVFLQP